MRNGIRLHQSVGVWYLTITRPTFCVSMMTADQLFSYLGESLLTGACCLDPLSAKFNMWCCNVSNESGFWDDVFSSRAVMI